MSLFHLDWFRCAGGYRIESFDKIGDEPGFWFVEMESGRTETGDFGLNIVANSEHWWPTRPLDLPGLYRQLADCEPNAEGALEFINRHGFLNNPKSYAEPVADAVSTILAMRELVDDIDDPDWQMIAQTLDGWGDTSSGGIGQLGIILETPPDLYRPPYSTRPTLKLRPANLGSALQVQALEDACLGINLRNCKSPECPEYLGSNSHRPQAEYCSQKCQRHHSYLKRKAAKQ